jgi:hypothetical protein
MQLPNENFEPYKGIEPASGAEQNMKTYTVYRVDYRTNKHELIGKVVDRRSMLL